LSSLLFFAVYVAVIIMQTGLTIGVYLIALFSVLSAVCCLLFAICSLLSLLSFLLFFSFVCSLLFFAVYMAVIIMQTGLTIGACRVCACVYVYKH
jgi:hypothetical protein